MGLGGQRPSPCPEAAPLLPAASGSGSGSPVRLGLEPELNTMMEKETMATEKMVPFTMGTLDTKSIGLTSATIRARAYLRP